MDPSILVMCDVQELHYFIFICEVTIISHTFELMVELGLGFEGTSINGTQCIARLENVPLRLKVAFKGI